MAKAKKQSRPRAAKVWHIFHFEQRFELTDDSRKCRKGALLFIRCVVSPNDDESINLDEQIRSLRCVAEEGMEEALMEGCFWRLTKAAANRSRIYRGYLLDERYRPATTGRIAMWLGLDSKRTGQVLRCLEKAGLIERAAMPDFEQEPEDGPPSETPTPEPTPEPTDTKKHEPKGKGKARGKTASKGAKTRKKTNSAEGRKIPPPFKKEEHEHESKPRPSASAEKEKENPRPSASEGEGKAQSQQEAVAASGGGRGEGQEQSEKGKGQTHLEAEAEGRAESRGQAEANSTGQGKDEPARAPATTPPMPMPRKPTEAEREGTGAEREGTGAGWRTVEINLWNERFRDYGGCLFADRVYACLKVPEMLARMNVPGDQVEQACWREHGNYAAYWKQVIAAGLSRTAMMRLWDRGVDRARQIGCNPEPMLRGRKNGRAGNPCRVWRYEAKMRLAAAIREERARASPSVSGAI